MNNQKARNKEHAEVVALAWTDHAWDDYLWWQRENGKILGEISGLIDECRRTPFAGTGKPEPLKGDLSGFWSRRITKEHRLVYLPEDGALYVVACRYHY